MPIKCRKCGFENPSDMDYCGSCGCSFDGTEKTARSLKGIPSPPSRAFDWEERGRVSLLLYLGVILIGFSGVLYALMASASIDGRSPPSYTAYATAIVLIGIAFALVGFARQAKRMRE